MKNRIVIIGSSGIISSNLQKKFTKSNYKFITLGRNKINLKKKDSFKLLSKKVKKKDIIIFISAEAPAKNIQMFLNNIMICDNICKALQNKPFSKLIYISSDAVYSDISGKINEKTKTFPGSMHGMMHLTREIQLKMNFDNEPKILTRDYKTDDKNFIEGIYSFVVSNKDLSLDLSKSNFIETNVFKDKKFYQDVDVSTDDWPFFYMSYRIYPISYVVLISVIFFISLFFLKNLTKMSMNKFSYPSFFLGVGFMLMETKGITELAKIYGSTWFVVSVVITAILTMAYLANLFIIKGIKISINQIYFFLILSLLLSYSLSFINYYNYPIFLLKLIIPIILTFPVFFSGLAFSKELVRYGSTANALSCNILGAIVGGLLEYNSMYFGFKFLYLLAIFFYFMAYVSSSKLRLVR